MRINGFDIDGVIFQGSFYAGIRPGPHDVIITGRSFEEEKETLAFLRNNGIDNVVFFNQLPFDSKTRRSSGMHKANTISNLKEMGIELMNFFEDDPIQAAVIRESHPELRVVEVHSPHINKENRRQEDDLIE